MQKSSISFVHNEDLDPIIVFGKGQLAINICDYLKSAGYEILVIPVTPEPGWSPSLISYCDQMELTTCSFDDFEKSYTRFSLGISIYFDKVFKPNHIDRFDLLLNIHNSILPKYRGVNPINWALKNLEKEHGISLHKIETGIDTGPIYGIRRFAIDAENLEVEDLYQVCLREAYLLFCEVFPILNQITPLPQEESEATYYSSENRAQLGERLGIRRKNP
jgi:methionyl-tRNA formyltransferase